MNKSNNSFATSVYVKTTNHGDCLNYISICPEKYKTGVIKTFLHRGYAICSNWTTFHKEIERIKQILTNNNYPMQLIDDTVNEFLRSKLRTADPTQVKNKIEIFFEGQMCSNYKVDENQLTTIISKYIKPADDDHQICLTIYYKNKKLKNLLIRNKKRLDSDAPNRHHVVYLYTCNQEGCNSSQTYVGYTTCTIDERFRMHAQTGSIKKHLMEKHGLRKVSKSDLTQSTSVLKSCDSKGRLRMTEAILIKELKPTLNSQDEGCDKLLKIFKH